MASHSSGSRHSLLFPPLPSSSSPSPSPQKDPILSPPSSPSSSSSSSSSPSIQCRSGFVDHPCLFPSLEDLDNDHPHSLPPPSLFHHIQSASVVALIADSCVGKSGLSHSRKSYIGELSSHTANLLFTRREGGIGGGGGEEGDLEQKQPAFMAFTPKSVGDNGQHARELSSHTANLFSSGRGGGGGGGDLEQKQAVLVASTRKSIGDNGQHAREISSLTANLLFTGRGGGGEEGDLEQKQPALMAFTRRSVGDNGQHAREFASHSDNLLFTGRGGGGDHEQKQAALMASTRKPVGDNEQHSREFSPHAADLFFTRRGGEAEEGDLEQKQAFLMVSTRKSIGDSEKHAREFSSHTADLFFPIRGGGGDHGQDLAVMASVRKPNTSNNLKIKEPSSQTATSLQLRRADNEKAVAIASSSPVEKTKKISKTVGSPYPPSPPSPSPSMQTSRLASFLARFKISASSNRSKKNGNDRHRHSSEIVWDCKSLQLSSSDGRAGTELVFDSNPLYSSCRNSSSSSSSSLHTKPELIQQETSPRRNFSRFIKPFKLNSTPHSNSNSSSSSNGGGGGGNENIPLAMASSRFSSKHIRSAGEKMKRCTNLQCSRMKQQEDAFDPSSSSVCSKPSSYNQDKAENLLESPTSRSRILRRFYSFTSSSSTSTSAAASTDHSLHESKSSSKRSLRLPFLSPVSKPKTMVNSQSFHGLQQINNRSPHTGKSMNRVKDLRLPSPGSTKSDIAYTGRYEDEQKNGRGQRDVREAIAWLNGRYLMKDAAEIEDKKMRRDWEDMILFNRGGRRRRRRGGGDIDVSHCGKSNSGDEAKEEFLYESDSSSDLFELQTLSSVGTGTELR